MHAKLRLVDFRRLYGDEGQNIGPRSLSCTAAIEGHRDASSVAATPAQTGSSASVQATVHHDATASLSTLSRNLFTQAWSLVIKRNAFSQQTHHVRLPILIMRHMRRVRELLVLDRLGALERGDHLVLVVEQLVVLAMHDQDGIPDLLHSGDERLVFEGAYDCPTNQREEGGVEWTNC
jgi:hypothetical protein